MKQRTRTAAPKSVFRGLADLYDRMQQAYDKPAESIGFTCEGCPTNCCTSYFQHHTYIEWAYLWKGMEALPEGRRETYLERARGYVEHSKSALAEGKRPDAMCPLNDDGLCGVYSHRLMICRLHGVPNRIIRGFGDVMEFPGCWRFSEQAGDGETPVLDRTPLYRELAGLEMRYLGNARGRLPKVDLTLAEMLVQGKPKPIL